MRLVNIISVALITLVLQLQLAGAEEIPHPCEGQNLLKALQTKDPAAAERVLQRAAQIPNSGAVLWKITPKNGVKPSWLLGTIHVSDTRITTLSDHLKQIIAASTVAVFELKEVGDKEAFKKLARNPNPKFTNLPAGKTLWDYIPDKDEAALRRNMLFAMIPAAKRDTLQPWVIAAGLAMPLCEQLRKPFFPVLDEAVAAFAKSSNVPIRGLENIDEQLGVMSGMKLRDQALMLTSLANLEMKPEDSFVTMEELYLSRQVSVGPLLMQQMHGNGDRKQAKLSAGFERRLLGKRNVKMVSRAAPLIDQGGAFIAVGALHLPGKDGVIELLRKKGYKVEAGE